MVRKYQIKTIPVGMISTNCYLFTETASKKTLIIDPGEDAERIERVITEDDLCPVGILNTHGHADHIAANGAIKNKYKIPLYVHKDDAGCMTNAFKNVSIYLGKQVFSPKADVLLEDGSVIDVGELKLHVMHTPGHTPGSICAKTEDVVFTGDTLFRNSIGRTDLEGGSEEEIMKSLERLRKIPPDYKIFPGHELASTIADELKSNPFMQNGRL